MNEGQWWQKALDLLEEMRDSHVQHNVVTYSATISTCKRANGDKKALGWPDERRGA